MLLYKLLLLLLSSSQALLREYGPVVLRGYYERDARHSFCQANLWTEPYLNLMAALAARQQQSQGGMVVTTAAVVQALLTSLGLTGSDDINSNILPAAAAQRGSSSAGAAGDCAVSGLRTTALLSLLRTSPQCVPFPVRLELFRQMMQQDKVKGGRGHNAAHRAVYALPTSRDRLLQAPASKQYRE